MRKGFTLIELMIVIAIIAIIAAIAIPNLLESRITANEGAASATLKSGVFPAQVQFQAGGYQDSDGDNVGEYGTLEYLAGVRLGTNSPAGTVIRLLQGALSANNAVGATSRQASKYLYIAQVHTVDGAGPVAGALINEGTVLPAAGAGAMNGVSWPERYWLCGATPLKFNDDGRRVFMIAHDGQVRSPAGANANARTLVMAPLAGSNVASCLAGIATTLGTAADQSTYINAAALEADWTVYTK